MKVDFYVLESSSRSACEQFACKLIEKVFNLNHRVYVHADSVQQVNTMDNLLWTFNQGSFLPHGIVDENDKCNNPIALGCNDKLTCHYDVLINLSSNVPDVHRQFSRIVEFVGADKSLARNKFRHYQQLDYEINTHNINT